MAELVNDGVVLTFLAGDTAFVNANTYTYSVVPGATYKLNLTGATSDWQEDLGDGTFVDVSDDNGDHVVNATGTLRYNCTDAGGGTGGFVLKT